MPLSEVPRFDIRSSPGEQASRADHGRSARSASSLRMSAGDIQPRSAVYPDKPTFANGNAMTIPANIASFEKLLDGPRDGALLRYSLGNAWLQAGEPTLAAERLREAVAKDPNYSAAWKLLGKALTAGGDKVGALAAYQQGIVVAEARGDVQAAKEMKIFAKRLATF